MASFGSVRAVRLRDVGVDIDRAIDLERETAELEKEFQITEPESHGGEKQMAEQHRVGGPALPGGFDLDAAQQEGVSSGSAQQEAVAQQKSSDEKTDTSKQVDVEKQLNKDSGEAIPGGLYPAEVTWHFQNLLHPYAVATGVLAILCSTWFTCAFQTATFFRDEKSDEQNIMFFIAGLGGAIMWMPFISSSTWVAYCVARGDKTRFWWLALSILSGMVYCLEVTLRGKRVLFAIVILITVGPFFFILPCKAGPRRLFGLSVWGMIVFFQAGAYLVARFLPRIVEKMPGITGTFLFPLFASGYEVFFMPMIFALWNMKARRDSPVIALVFLVASVRYTGESIFYAGILLSVDREDDDLIAFASALLATLTRCFFKFNGRIGTWHMLRSKVLGKGYNDMNAKRDLVGRIATNQVWLGLFITGSLGFAYATLQFTASIEGESGSNDHYSGVMARAVLWPALVLANICSLTMEFSVACVVWMSRGGSRNPLSRLQTFNRMHLPGMQSLIGVGQRYDSKLHHPECVTGSAGAMVISDEAVIELWPCVSMHWHGSILCACIFFAWNLAIIPTYQNTLL